MLSNLRIRSNLIKCLSPSERERLSGLELHSIFERCPNLGISFDPSRYDGLTKRQIEQWDARLFWGDSRIHLTPDCWRASIRGLATQEFPALARDQRDLIDEETAIELLWLVSQAARWTPDMGVIVNQAKTRLVSFLSTRGFTERGIVERIEAIGGVGPRLETDPSQPGGEHD